MAHFYNCKDTTDPSFEPDIETPAKARKVNKVYPSVTTVLGIVKDAFLDSIYKPRMMTDLARKNPFLPWQELERMTYGFRKHPATNEDIPSSEFGTAVHKTIEDMIESLIWDRMRELPEGREYDDWAEPFYQWVLDNDVKPIACERIIADNRIKIAGSVDFIGHDSDGKVFLADYKCRTNTKGKAKTYDKDCQQLAIESWMLMKQHKLDYLPSCISVVIDCDTKKHHHKVWDSDEMQKGIKVAKKCAELYWLLRM
jgi:hypothetical protein|tara:strand:+ start:113 stop:877 length:765 start_codon:yes stop_codon:yes gene_type:complete